MFNLVIIKNNQSITPPPVIAQTLAQNSRDYLQKYGHVTNQLRRAVKVPYFMFYNVFEFWMISFVFYREILLYLFIDIEDVRGFLFKIIQISL